MDGQQQAQGRERAGAWVAGGDDLHRPGYLHGNTCKSWCSIRPVLLPGRGREGADEDRTEGIGQEQGVVLGGGIGRLARRTLRGLRVGWVKNEVSLMRSLPYRA